MALSIFLPRLCCQRQAWPVCCRIWRLDHSDRAEWWPWSCLQWRSHSPPPPPPPPIAALVSSLSPPPPPPPSLLLSETEIFNREMKKFEFLTAEEFPYSWISLDSLVSPSPLPGELGDWSKHLATKSFLKLFVESPLLLLPHLTPSQNSQWEGTPLVSRGNSCISLGVASAQLLWFSCGS